MRRWSVTVVSPKRLTEEMVQRLERIEMQEDIWFFCLDTLKWDTKKIVCDKAYLTETGVLVEHASRECARPD